MQKHKEQFKKLMFQHFKNEYQKAINIFDLKSDFVDDKSFVLLTHELYYKITQEDKENESHGLEDYRLYNNIGKYIYFANPSKNALRNLDEYYQSEKKFLFRIDNETSLIQLINDESSNIIDFIILAKLMVLNG